MVEARPDQWHLSGRYFGFSVNADALSEGGAGQGGAGRGGAVLMVHSLETGSKLGGLTEVFQVLPGDKLVVVVHGGLWALLQLLCQVIQEGTPAGSRTQSLV